MKSYNLKCPSCRAESTITIRPYPSGNADLTSCPCCGEDVADEEAVYWTSIPDLPSDIDPTFNLEQAKTTLKRIIASEVEYDKQVLDKHFMDELD